MPHNTLILIVEDDPDQIMIYKDQFEIGGFDVTTAENFEEVIAKTRNTKPDVVLLDIRLQYENTGLAILKHLKTDDNTKNIPVVVFTNFSKKAYEEETMALGATKYIVKTDRLPREIVEDVKEVLEKGEK